MAEWEWDEEGNEYVERILREILPVLLAQVEDALKDALRRAKYFVSFSDLTRYILLALEERVRLTPRAKEFIYRNLRRYTERPLRTHSETFPSGMSLTCRTEGRLSTQVNFTTFTWEGSSGETGSSGSGS
ncbi:MAG: hypothetical protein Q9N34_01275 [Aquificota bacterium]|nr:hypothetical protein [Aquificota bacterium]